ncbi:hypothetical protein K466DRAFT_591961 [Polyporus arcularius HHB13444]|uniref:Uncharacterized protein n=1 Tax=Polyporus arcularius HHB13444 TaxID=1314778 RepID=A0A5C3NSM2_9APHY|nr:hypothetical protein K466DRAFT_591961 [Polyporus arcularius HHB13444]
MLPLDALIVRTSEHIPSSTPQRPKHRRPMRLYLDALRPIPTPYTSPELDPAHPQPRRRSTRQPATDALSHATVCPPPQTRPQASSTIARCSLQLSHTSTPQLSDSPERVYYRQHTGTSNIRSLSLPPTIPPPARCPLSSCPACR